MEPPAVQEPGISYAQYEAIRANETASCAALASKWRVEAVGRDYPLFLSRAGPALAGEWYVIRGGVRCKATSAQARDLDYVGRYGVYAIGPVYAGPPLTRPNPPDPASR